MDQLIDQFLKEEWELAPTTASGHGLTEYDDRLEDLSEAGWRRRDDHADSWRQRFEQASEDGLSLEQRIDRGVVLAALSGRAILRDWEGWRRDPALYTTPILQGIFRLFLHRLRAEPDLVDAAVARLDAVPGALQAGGRNLDPALAHPLILERGAAAARAGARYLRDLLPGEVAQGEGRDRLERSGDAAGRALESFADRVDAVTAQATGDWRLGEERYTRILREKERLGDDARGLRERGQAEYDRLDAEMRRLARDARGTEDWNAVLREADRDHVETEEGMRQAYAEWTARARQFLDQTGLATLPPGEQCVVEPAPVFQRPLLGVAFYIAPPAFAQTRTGHFFVPFAPEGTSADEIEKRLRGNSNGGMPTTAVHEAYPGHHWHLTMMKGNPRPLRRVMSTPYFSEGWALYAERAMRERGFFTDPIQELYHLQATIFRAARIVVDTSLHVGEMSEDEAIRFMVDKAGLPEPTARAEVGRYCWWPTQAASYLTGCLEILRIRDRYLEARGVGGQAPADVDIAILREFHDGLASSGSLPLGLAEQAILEPVAQAGATAVPG